MSHKPRLGCAAIVKDGDRVLLGVRDKEPHKGLWILPGGGVDFGEALCDTVIREFKEECGITVAVDDLFTVKELIMPPDEHRVVIYFIAHYVSGDLTPSSDLSDAQFLSVGEIERLYQEKKLTPLVADVLRDAGIIK